MKVDIKINIEQEGNKINTGMKGNKRVPDEVEKYLRQMAEVVKLLKDKPKPYIKHQRSVA